MFICAKCGATNYPAIGTKGCECCGYNGIEIKINTDNVTPPITPSKTHPIT